MSQHTIRLASGEQHLPYVGHVTTTPRLVWLPEEAVKILRALGAIIGNPADESPAPTDEPAAQPPAPGPVKPRKGR